MASWKKVLVSGQDLTDTTDLTGNTGQLGIGTGGGITLNGAVADVDGLLGTATVNLAMNVNGLGSADIAEATDLIPFYDNGTSASKKTTVAVFTGMLAGAAATTGLRNIAATVELNTAAAAAISTPAGTEKILVWDGSAHKSITVAQIAAEASDGDITSVVAGDGLTGGATSGDAGLAVGAGSLIDVAADTVSVDLTEAAAATVAAGDFLIFLDGGTSGAESKGSVNGVATLFAGAGLTATDGVIAVDDVSLGSGTSGNYASAVTAGANIAVTGNAGEGTSFEVALATNVDVGGTLDVTGVATFDNNVVVGGTLTVQGDTTTIESTNLLVDDTFISLNDNATADADTGIVFGGAANKVFGWDHSQESGRFGVDYAGGNAAVAGGGFSPDAWVSTAHTASGDSGSATADLAQIGNMYINSANQDIYIYS